MQLATFFDANPVYQKRIDSRDNGLCKGYGLSLAPLEFFSAPTAQTSIYTLLTYQLEKAFAEPGAATPVTSWILLLCTGRFHYLSATDSSYSCLSPCSGRNSTVIG